MPKYLEFRLPDVGEGLTEADIVDWKVTVGDAVTVNQALVEIETAKSLVELPSPHAGVITKVLVEAGATVEVGTPIVVIDTDPDGAPEADGGSPAVASGTGGAADGAASADDETSGDVLVGYGTKHAAASRRPRRAAEPAPAAPAAAPPSPPAPATEPATMATVDGQAAAPSSTILAKPPVRKLAKDLGIDLNRVPGTGPGGIITRGDVEAAAQRSEPERLVSYPGDDRPWLDGGVVSADGRQTRVPVRSVRARTAEAMVASAFTAPHVTVFQTVDVTKTMKLVARLKEDRDFSDTRVTPLLIAAKALILAIRRHPTISAAWDDATQEIVYKHYINLGIAASTPRGLVVPNIKDAHRMGLHELAVALGDLTATARAGKTTPAAMTDGTVTITNVGVFGIDTGTPILNPGEAAILAFGAISQRPWVHHGKIKPRWVTQLALSMDHRLIDGELGSRVLADTARTLADPAQGLVWG
ncbi:dihydrolipoamide acetyltransferase family protein [Occultella aeris]|uniref:Dihydrolipoamide acetyltransferase component of pyruvate dehydrogenase complex n=1 Tax=Occultella aeris TaxID=2761496 RepID=A0A7M4DEB6_9MICO|nr:dihydrolipoamide acetyltransferase family protein [Occultella aeris]VZO35230.1 Dihydrolipoyllysine-residue acetyltransferase component of pyruvate dehydrogenase complex [Occultella aeris]